LGGRFPVPTARECHELAPDLKGEGLDLESMISLINKQEESK